VKRIEKAGNARIPARKVESKKNSKAKTLQKNRNPNISSEESEEVESMDEDVKPKLSMPELFPEYDG
jgi:hypothetical protein